MGATELISPKQESPARAKDSQVMCPSLEDTLAPSRVITGTRGDSSAPIGIEAKLQLLIKNTNPAQLTLWEDSLDNSVLKSLDDWCMVQKRKKN